MIDLNAWIELFNPHRVYSLKDFINDVSSIENYHWYYNIILQNIWYDKAEIINLFVEKLGWKMSIFRTYINSFIVHFENDELSEYIYKEYNANKKNKNPINYKKDDKVDKVDNIDSNKSSDKIIIDEEIHLTN